MKTFLETAFCLGRLVFETDLPIFRKHRSTIDMSGPRCYSIAYVHQIRVSSSSRLHLNDFPTLERATVSSRFLPCQRARERGIKTAGHANSTGICRTFGANGRQCLKGRGETAFDFHPSEILKAVHFVYLTFTCEWARICMYMCIWRLCVDMRVSTHMYAYGGLNLVLSDSLDRSIVWTEAGSLADPSQSLPILAN